MSSKIRAAKAYVEVLLDKTGLKRGFAWMKQAASKAGAGLRSIGGGLLAFGSGAGFGFGFAAKKFAEFDDQMRTVKAVTGASTEDFKQLTNVAQELGRTTGYTASQVAGLMTELGRAGFNPREIEAATPGILNLAYATGTELPRAAEIGAAALRGFGLDVSQSDRVADVLTTTVSSSAQSMEDLFEAMKPVAPIAASAGESLEDTAAAIGVLANNGIKGSLAGNALGRAFKNLSSDATASKLRAIGVEAKDNQGNLRPLIDIIQDIGKQTEDLGTGDRLAAFETIFGRAQAAAIKLAEGSGFDELRTRIVESEGAAKKAADEMDKGLGGAFRRISSAIEGAVLASVEHLAGDLSTLTDSVTEIVGSVTKWIRKNPGLAKALLVLTIGSIALGGALTALGFVLPLIAAGIAAVLSPVGIAIGLVAGLGGGLIYLAKQGTDLGGVFAWLREKFGPLADAAKQAFDGIKNALNAGDYKLAARLLWLGIKVAWLQGTQDLRQKLIELKHTFLDVWNTMRSGAELALAKIAATAAKAMLHARAVIDKNLAALLPTLTAAIDIGLEARLKGIQSQAAEASQQRNQSKERELASSSEELANTRAEMAAALATAMAKAEASATEAADKLNEPNKEGQRVDESQLAVSHRLNEVAMALKDGQIAQRIRQSTSTAPGNLKSVQGIQTLIGIANQEKAADEVRRLNRDQKRRHREAMKKKPKPAEV